ncbi:ABC transporter substrate-binding protein [Paenibacillus rigui]|uniref:ABC transporter substrate-binding protein n=2 Tax=Paenibacillus rigui TaxID=554312 RepID=A0A229UP78_9BACL|nr:ABC transporter substrate-binding protein [Paenibacillus rigui]
MKDGYQRSRLPLVVVLLVLLSCILSCSPVKEMSGGTPAAKSTVSLIVKMNQGDYWGTVRMGAEAAAKEFNVNLNVSAPADEKDVQGQIQLVNEAVSAGTDALVLAANDYKGLAEASERAAGQRIPVITIDSEVNSPKVLSFIGINNYEAGKKAGSKLVEQVSVTSRIAVLNFGAGAKNADEREQGLLDELARYPQVEVVSREYCYSDLKLCRELTKKLLTEKHADGIVALHAIASIGVADEVSAMGLAGKVQVVTFDNTPEDIEFLQEGVIQATIIQNPFSMGYLGVKYAVEAIQGKKIPKFVDTGTKVIDQENMFWSDNQKLLFPFVK